MAYYLVRATNNVGEKWETATVEAANPENAVKRLGHTGKDVIRVYELALDETGSPVQLSQNDLDL